MTTTASWAAGVPAHVAVIAAHAGTGIGLPAGIGLGFALGVVVGVRIELVDGL